MHKISYLLLIILIWLQYSLWFGKNGILDFINIVNIIKLYNNEYNLDYMKIRNDQLLLEIYDLLYENDVIEEYARYDLGMIKSGECFYQYNCYNNTDLK